MDNYCKFKIHCMQNFLFKKEYTGIFAFFSISSCKLRNYLLVYLSLTCYRNRMQADWPLTYSI